MDETYYAICFWEPAAPAFCSAERMYIGTLAQIGAVIDKLRARSELEGTVSAWDAFCNGERNAQHNVAYRDIPLLRPVRFFRSGKLNLGERVWDHLNAWNCPYTMRFLSAEVTEILVELEGTFYRCLHARMTDFCYEELGGAWKPLTDGFWGNGFVLDVSEDTGGRSVVSNLLFEVEDASKNEDDFKDLFLCPENLDFSPICDEVFGDG